MEAVQEQAKIRSLELKRELKSCGVFYLSARGEIVAPHTVEVNPPQNTKNLVLGLGGGKERQPEPDPK